MSKKTFARALFDPFNLFGTHDEPDRPRTPEPPPTPPSVDDEGARAGERERERIRRQRGRASTILTGGAGLGDPGASLATKTLLGQ